jgi:AbrB family looped-hinge helix DNA binding protein
LANYTSSVSATGQITLPSELRERLGIQPRDRVAIRLDGNEIVVTALHSAINVIAGSVTALNPPRPWAEVIAIAREEMAQNAAAEGRDAE